MADELKGKMIAVLAADGVEQVDSLPADPDLCLVLGGDGYLYTTNSTTPAATRSTTEVPSRSSIGN